MKISLTALLSYFILAQDGHMDVLGVGTTAFVDQEEPSFSNAKARFERFSLCMSRVLLFK